MGYKKGDIKNKNNAEEITTSFFGTETLNKAKEVEKQVRAKRKYTKLTSRENKTKVIQFRVTENEYNKLLEKAESTKSGSISAYLQKLINKG